MAQATWIPAYAGMTSPFIQLKCYENSKWIPFWRPLESPGRREDEGEELPPEGGFRGKSHFFAENRKNRENRMDRMIRMT